MKLLLVSCYELGRQPLGIASPAAFLRRAGFEPHLHDLSVESLDPELVRQARFVGLSVPMHTALRMGVLAAQRVRALNPSCHICFFGLYAVMNSDYLLREGLADSCLGGELEGEMVELVEAIASGAELDSKADGVVRIERLAYPPPRRDELPPLDRYARLQRNGEQSLAGAVEASRGCKHHCRHCPIPPVYGGRFFAIPAEVVLSDVDRLVDLGARHITFADPDFLNGPKHALRIARAVHQAHPGLTWDFTAKVEHLIGGRALLHELAGLGCLVVVSAVESLSDRVLQVLDKGHSRADVLEALEATRAAGIVLRPSLIPFTPWSTLADTMDLLDWVESEGIVDHVDPVQYGIRLLIPPGSLLLDRSELRPHLRPLDETRFSYRWVHPDPRMDELQGSIASLTERETTQGDDPWVTFHHVRNLALTAQGGSPAVVPPSPPGAPAPRLTESWFC